MVETIMTLWESFELEQQKKEHENGKTVEKRGWWEIYIICRMKLIGYGRPTNERDICMLDIWKVTLKGPKMMVSMFFFLACLHTNDSTKHSFSNVDGRLLS